MSDFTPGPWEVRQHLARISIVNPRAKHPGNRGGGAPTIAYTTVAPDSVQAPVALANARLIAAAPELYEALVEALSWPSVRAAISGHALECRLDAALAKARGEA